MWQKLPESTGLYWVYHEATQRLSTASVILEDGLVVFGYFSSSQMKCGLDELANRGLWFFPANVPPPPVFCDGETCARES